MWLNEDCLDGVKHVCMDRLNEAIEEGKCLVYSFGLSVDWSFEQAMADLGCTVKAFDPTVEKKPDYITNENIHVYPVGLGARRGKQKVCESVSNYTRCLVSY